MDPENLPPPWPPWALDMTGDGRVTIGDLSRWAAEAFFLPGDWAIWALARYLPGLAGFLELGADSYGGVLSAFVSAFAWLAVLLVLVIVWQSVHRFDDALTRRIRLGYVETLRRGRIAWARIRYRLRRGKPAHRPSEIEFAETLDLTPAHLEILRAALDLEPKRTLEVGALARKLEMSRREAARLFDELASLDLLAPGGRGRGASAYTITTSGRAYLVFRQLAPRT
jgi:AraC-like DNA-binding protein